MTSLRRLCYAASLIASVVAILAEVNTWEHPLAWAGVAIGFLALAGTVD